MDNLDDSENNAKISDSAYSNSCSNSQSRRSHSSKSTHSGSNSSGSSGYGGKPSTSGSSNKHEQTKKDKDSKKKKQSQTEVKDTEAPAVVECRPPEPIPPFDAPKEEIIDVVESAIPILQLPEKAVENIEGLSTELNLYNDEVQIATMQASTNACLETSCQVANSDSNGFSCAISMHDGVVMYTTQSLTNYLGFPKDMWIGRSFIDFVHPKDRDTFASQVTNGLAVPKIVGNQTKAQPDTAADCNMGCRIRRYRSLSLGYGVKERIYLPFLLKFSFKDISDDDGKIIYLIIQATPFCSAFKTPNEVITNATPFIIKHSAAGILEYIDIESVPYLGYMPQDIHNRDAFFLYHPEDLAYITMIYETIVKEGSVSKSLPYRMLTQNGDYVRLETEWSSFINPWSMKLEFVVGKHHVLEGPAVTDVFLNTPITKPTKTKEGDKQKNEEAAEHRQNILRILKDVLTKPAEKAKQQMSKRCQDLAMIMENLLEDQSKPTFNELRVDIQEQDNYERDSVMLGGISPHHDHNDSKSSTETPLSYNQLNYNENLQRYFDSYQSHCFDDTPDVVANVMAVKDRAPSSASRCLSPLAQNSGESNDLDSTSSTALVFHTYSPPTLLGDSPAHKLTETVLNKHNTEMEKKLAKTHRGTRSSSKGEKAYETRQKKKEHLARCNASYQPTMAGAASAAAQQHGLKRALRPMEADVANKHHCSVSRQTRKRQHTNVQPSMNPPPVSTAAHWPDVASGTPMSAMNPYALGGGLPQPMTMMTGMFPMYYPTTAVTSSHVTATPTHTTEHARLLERQASVHQAQFAMQSQGMQNDQLVNMAQNQMHHYPSPALPWMYPQQVYMYPQMQYNVQQQAMMAHSMSYNQSLNPLALANSNYLQACKTFPLKPSKPVEHILREKKEAEENQMASSSNMEQSSGDNSSTALERESMKELAANQESNQEQTTESMPEPKSVDKIAQQKTSGQCAQNSDETMDRTDGESSYSSFYSSFFKTESGSAEESNDSKNRNKGPADGASYTFDPLTIKKAPRRKMIPPWMEKVSMTQELLYKYQIPHKSKEEVLRADKERMKRFEQPALVNEQLGQLYLDLQLEGVASRLTLEEGITSSSSSSEDNSNGCTTHKAKPHRRIRHYSRLNMIYEEDGPLPPVPEEPAKELSTVKKQSSVENPITSEKPSPVKELTAVEEPSTAEEPSILEEPSPGKDVCLSV